MALMSTSRRCDLLLASEGGWSNRLADHGWARMYGITQATHDAWPEDGSATAIGTGGPEGPNPRTIRERVLAGR